MAIRDGVESCGSSAGTKLVLQTAREISVVVLDNEDDVSSGLPAVGGRTSMQAAADCEVGFNGANKAPEKGTADTEGQGN